MSGAKFLVLGCGEGWHADQLSLAAARAGCQLDFADYESLRGSVGSPESTPTETAPARLGSSEGDFCQYEAILPRTMPAGSLEQITFRLAVLHAYEMNGGKIVNPPRALEIAIDKFATLACVAKMGFPVPQTRVTQTRVGAMKAFEELGGDCVVKPIFGGEGRGVMRITDQQLAWYTFATLERLSSVFYVQKFVSPGGRDTRLLVVGDQVFGLRRENANDFRTNVSGGATTHVIDVSQQQRITALRICRAIGLKFASVDLIDSDDGEAKVLEVNAIPGWRGAQSVLSMNIADEIIRLMIQHAELEPEPAS